MISFFCGAANMGNVILFVRVLPLCVLLGFGYCSEAAADWAESANPLIVSPKPSDGSEELQNPPGFSWARAQGAQSYELILRGPDGNEQSFQASRNWFLPHSRLKPGEYTWKVRPTRAGGSWSDQRRFSLSANATVFEVPDDENLLRFIRARSKPRSLPTGEKGVDVWAGVVRAQRAKTIQALENKVRAYASKPLVDEQSVLFVPRVKDEKAWAASLTTIRVRTQDDSRQLRAAALLWHATGNRFYLAEAKRRGAALAALNPGGSTSHVQQDQGNRAIAWGLTVAYDYLSAELSPKESAIWRASIRSRTAAIYSDLKSGGWRLEQTPYDSHGSTNIGYLAAISALMIDDLPEAEEWFRNSFRGYVHYQSPWGDEQGGFAMGSAYAEYSVWYFLDSWDSIAAATGVSIYEKPWSKGLLKFLACFVPPGNPSHTFGDAAETKPWISPIKEFANHYNDDLARWYSQNLVGQEDPFTALTNPIYHERLGTIEKEPLENTCMFKHIGWTAMHSHWADPKRTSVYFKSSPYAAFSHNHADNNSFVLVSGGEPLLIDSGYYDWYGSPHWKGWYWRSKAHNMVTFDGGKGQAEKSGPEKMTAIGRLMEFRSGGNVDVAEGDASAAYEGQLVQAKRRLWYLRNQNVLVVHDSLSSTIPRQFEWNIHALDTFVVKAPGAVEVKQNAASACIDMLRPSEIEFVQHNRFDPPPQGAVSRKDQWHGRFQNKERQTNVEFLAVIRVGCNNIPIEIKDLTNSRQLKIGGETIDIPR